MKKIVVKLTDTEFAEIRSYRSKHNSSGSFYLKGYSDVFRFLWLMFALLWYKHLSSEGE